LDFCWESISNLCAISQIYLKKCEIYFDDSNETRHICDNIYMYIKCAYVDFLYLLENFKKNFAVGKIYINEMLARLKITIYAVCINFKRFIIHMNQIWRDNACHAILKSKCTRILLLRVSNNPFFLIFFSFIKLP